jgi:glycosyltransferase involved in cell wall biosynthesis
MSARLFCVVAAFNEGATIAGVLRGLARYCDNVVVVDDGSQDDTSAQAKLSGATVIRHPFNLGQGAALQTGLTAALQLGADIVVTFDADGQHSPEDVPPLVAALTNAKADFALGSRFLGIEAQNMPLVRRLLLRASVLFTRVTTGLPLTDAHNGLRAMTARGAACIHLRQNRMAHASEMLNQIACSKLPVVEVPVRISYTDYSLAKGQRLSGAVDVLWDLFAARLYR